jgi:desulfoferrodoxin (superoxide reductase-like protein)
LTALRLEPKWIKIEFTERVTSSKELTVETEPDAEMMKNISFKGLLFSTF